MAPSVEAGTGRAARLPVIVVAAVHAAACAAVLSVPGLRVPGYMSALGAGFVLLLTGAPLGLCGPPPRDLRGALVRAGRRAALLFVLALLPALAWTVAEPVCAPGRAAAFWLLGPGFGAAFAVLLGVGVRRLAGRRVWLGLAALLLLLACSLAWHLGRLYLTPSVFFFHPVVGYLAGPIYDTSATIPWAYAVHRLTWLGAAPILLAPWTERPRRARLLGAAWLLVGVAAWGPSGVDPGRGGIESELGARVSGRHVELRADHEAYTPEMLDALSKVADFHAAEVSAWLGVAPPEAPVVAYLFKDAEQKRRLMGAGRTRVAKPWLNEVYLDSSQLDDPVMRHELAHVLAAPLAPGPLHVPARFGLWPQMVLVEGLATAATWEGGRNTPHLETAAMEHLGLRPSLQRLLGPAGFWTLFGPRAYTVSASFVAWFREAFGVRALQQAYGDGDLGGAAGEALSTLEARWVAECLEPRARALDGAELDAISERFARRPVYRRPCGLDIWELARRAIAEAAEGDEAEALISLSGLERATGGDPEVGAMRVTAARAAVEPGLMLKESADLLARDEVRERPGLASWLRLQRSDAAWWAAAPEAALEELALIDTRRIARGRARQVWVRRLLLARLQPGDERLLDMLSQRPGTADALDVTLAEAIRRPTDGLARYLHAFQAEGVGLWEQAAALHAGVGAPEGWPPVLVREAAYRAGRLQAVLGRTGAAREALERALGYETQDGYRVPIERWLRYLEQVDREGLTRRAAPAPARAPARLR